VIPSWFNTPARIAKLDTVAASWLGTRWAQNSQVKGPGGGVSCHLGPDAILRECGFPLPFSSPPGPAGWSLHNNDSLIEAFLDSRPEFASLLPLSVPSSSLPAPRPPLLPGDLLGFKVGRCVHHLGLVLQGNNFIHVWRQTGVIRSTLADSTYASRLVRIWRPLLAPRA